MHEPAAVTVPDTAVAFARLSGAVDTFCSAIAGFALLAGTRAFAFTALLAWREPVLGGVGLVLLAALGWLRWQCGGGASAHAAHVARKSRSAINHGNGSRAFMGDGIERHLPAGAERAQIACYNRPSESDSKRCAALVERRLSCACPNASVAVGTDVKRSRNGRFALPGLSVHTRR